MINENNRASRKIDPTTLVVPGGKNRGASLFAQAALKWFKFGFSIIPIVPGMKKTAVQWDSWLESLSIETITQYWRRNPNHEIGLIPGDSIIVFDADSPSSAAALAEVEKAFGAEPNLIVKTKRGVHHYFKRAVGSYARTDSHSTTEHPERIDVKTGRSMVVLPPSTGKEIEINEAENVNELVEVGQEFIDAVFRHNGRPVPRLPTISPSPVFPSVCLPENAARLEELVNHIDPDAGYEDWIHVFMAVFHETGGADYGLDLVDRWSSKGQKYKGRHEIEAKWRSLRRDVSNPVTIATLVKMAREARADVQAILGHSHDSFTVCETEVIDSAASRPEVNIKATDAGDVEHPLRKYSLRGFADEIERQAGAQVAVLGQIALKGQMSVWYAAPNTGKTLLVLSLLTEAIGDGRVEPQNVYYLNVDDSGQGLAEKLRLAEEFGFHMLAEGYRGFSTVKLSSIVTDLIDGDQAGDTILILDTLKKFVDLMDKGRTRQFGKLMRRFIVRGGTVIALAHTNKNPGPNGKPVYGGVSDIRDDFDCAYTLAVVGNPSHSEKIVEFENIKKRGDVLQSVAYSYSTENGISYSELLASVQRVDDGVLQPLKREAEVQSDVKLISVVISCLGEGINTKMKLADAVAERTGVSKRRAIQVIEKYTGDDPVTHRWKFAVGHRGAKVFVLLDPARPGSLYK